jgi:hypothetical protein
MTTPVLSQEVGTVLSASGTYTRNKEIPKMARKRSPIPNRSTLSRMLTSLALPISPTLRTSFMQLVLTNPLKRLRMEKKSSGTRLASIFHSLLPCTEPVLSSLEWLRTTNLVLFKCLDIRGRKSSRCKLTVFQSKD